MTNSFSKVILIAISITIDHRMIDYFEEKKSEREVFLFEALDNKNKNKDIDFSGNFIMKSISIGKLTATNSKH